MKITKYEHACLLLEENGQKLVVDPGSFVSRIEDDLSVDAIVITHIHGDHMDLGHFRQLVATNPGLTIYGGAEAIQALEDIEATKITVSAGQTETLGVFNLEFFGGDHAIVFETVPCENLGVLVNNSLYYPGDSFTKPGKPVEIIALPISGPWLKIGESIQFLLEVKPKSYFVTHEALLNDVGMMFTTQWVKNIAGPQGIETFALAPGESLE